MFFNIFLFCLKGYSETLKNYACKPSFSSRGMVILIWKFLELVISTFKLLQTNDLFLSPNVNFDLPLPEEFYPSIM